MINWKNILKDFEPHDLNACSNELDYLKSVESAIHTTTRPKASKIIKDIEAVTRIAMTCESTGLRLAASAVLAEAYDRDPLFAKATLKEAERFLAATKKKTPGKQNYLVELRYYRIAGSALTQRTELADDQRIAEITKIAMLSNDLPIAQATRDTLRILMQKKPESTLIIFATMEKIAAQGAHVKGCNSLPSIRREINQGVKTSCVSQRIVNSLRACVV